MSWFKKKESVEEQITKYYIPEDQIMGLFEMVDKDNNLQTNVTYYALWKKIEKIFPELDIKWKNWEIVTNGNKLCPYVVELKGGIRV